MSDVGLPGWVADPVLTPVWERVRSRFEQAGLRAEGAVVVGLTDRRQRHAIGDLLGRHVTRERVRIDLADLDARLRQRSGVGGLDAVLALLDTRPLQDRPSLRAARDEARDRPLLLAAELVQTSWATDWVAELRRTGLLTNRPGADDAVRAAAVVLLDLTAGAGPRRTQSRVELGARLLGDAHALDRDRLVHQVVLRGLGAASGQPVPRGWRGREKVWAAYGVEPDLLSRSCLVLGLRIAGYSPLARRLGLAADTHDPVHLTEWDLRRSGPLRVTPATTVLVCENPRVVEAVAERDISVSVVCVSGEPNLVVDRVLTDLADNGARLLYHGDFDWPGIAIANRAVERYAVQPWLMSADDYLDAVAAGGPELVGREAEPSWDAELGAAMRSHGRAVHEESVLPQLLDACGGLTG